MKIGIDARIVSREVTGAGRVVQTLINQLANYPEHQFVVFHTAAFLPQTKSFANIKYVLLDIAPSTFKNFLVAGWKMRSHNMDTLYYGFIDVPFFINIPIAAVVYDLFYMEDKYYFAKNGRCRYIFIKFITWWRLKAATSLIAISETTRTQIKRLPLMKNKKIFKIDLCLYKQDRQQHDTPLTLPRGIQPNTFILYVGNNRRHKNMKLIIEAFASIGKIPNLKLVLCGAIDPRYEDPMSLVTYYNAENEIIHLGHVPDPLLEQLYSDCAYVVIPSFYEGFGLPALEAASRGKAVLCSTAAALREVLGEAGIYKDPYDVVGWATAMEMLATNREKREEVASACFKRSKLYSAERFGRETIEALIETAKGY